MSASTILGCSRNDILANAGTALLQVKNARGLTLEEMGAQMHRTRESVSQYIAGEAEMGFITWERAQQAWPELVDLISETAAERDAKRRQRPLNIDLPTRKDRAA